MDTLFLILLPLVISSLGFLSYRHPTIARQILKPLLYLIVALFLLLQIFDLTTSTTYYKALDATRININRKQTRDIKIDSLYKAINNKDSINHILNELSIERQKSYEIYLSQTETRDSIRNSIYTIKESSGRTNNTYQLYCLAAFLIVLTLHGLSFLFDNIHNKEKVSDVNSSNEKTE